MKKKIQKLQLNKFAVAKLSNSNGVIGGGLECTDSYSCPADPPKLSVDVCPTQSLVPGECHGITVPNEGANAPF